jgi:hypothetical protein
LGLDFTPLLLKKSARGMFVFRLIFYRKFRMPSEQTGITPHSPKNILILSFSVEDLPLKAMSIGHIAANVPGLVNEIKDSAPASDLLYSIGFGSLLWNFIWQGNMPPGFRPLEFDVETEEDDEDELASGSDLTFCFFSSDSDLLHHLAEESQVHLKNIATVNEMVLASLVEDQINHNLVDNEKTTASVLVDKKFPEFAQSSFLFTLGMTPASPENSQIPQADHEILSGKLANNFNALTANETGLIQHLYSYQKENQYGHYLLAWSNSVDPFQKILSAVESPDSIQTPLGDLQINPTLHFLPSLEILAALRMGTLRMGSLSPTAKWK